MDCSKSSSQKFYQLHRGISVRRERFGLLFYDSKGPHLTLVHSGPLLEPNFFAGKVHLTDWIHKRFSGLPHENLVSVEMTVLGVLQKLLKKGLIVETLGNT